MVKKSGERTKLFVITVVDVWFFRLDTMPVPDPRVGNICVWLVSFLFFVVIIAGGSFLFMYVSLPQTESTFWFPVAGVVLISVPWLFWFLTFLYRVISRGGGCGGGGGGRGRSGGVRGSGGGNANVNVDGATSEAAISDSPVESPNIGAQSIRFRTAIVAGEQDGHGSSGKEGGDENHRSTTLSSISDNELDNISLTLPESEMPLALSMGS